MKIIKKILITVAFALPLLAGADTYDDLINAAKSGDITEVSTLINKGASIDTTDIEGNTLLMLATRDGHLDLVQYLVRHRGIEFPADPDTTLRASGPPAGATCA